MSETLAAVGAVVAAAVAVVALVVAIFARRDSSESAKAAKRSAKAAADSLALSQDAMALQLERTDVEWALFANETVPGKVSVHHVGSTLATKVRVSITVNRARLPDVVEERVDPDGIVEVDALDEYRAANDQLELALQVMITKIQWDVEARITWHSPLGKPGSQVVTLP